MVRVTELDIAKACADWARAFTLHTSLSVHCATGAVKDSYMVFSGLNNYNIEQNQKNYNVRHHVSMYYIVKKKHIGRQRRKEWKMHH